MGWGFVLAFRLSNKVGTGIEYPCASHMIRMDLVAEGLNLTRTCRAHHRADGKFFP